MDYEDYSALPVAKRTRSMEAQRFEKMHAQIKGKTNGAGSSSFKLWSQKSKRMEADTTGSSSEESERRELEENRERDETIEISDGEYEGSSSGESEGSEEETDGSEGSDYIEETFESSNEEDEEIYVSGQETGEKEDDIWDEEAEGEFLGEQIGSTSNPFDVEAEDVGDWDIDGEDGYDDNGTARNKNLKRGRTTGKRKRAYDDDEVIQLLGNTILDEEKEHEQIVEPIIQPILPLKFTFGVEESIPVEKSIEEKELDRLWDEMNLSLYTNTDDEPKAELDSEANCTEGRRHFFILDEEIGKKCKFCSFVESEIRHCAPPFAKNPFGNSERRYSYLEEDDLFDKLHDHQDFCNDTEDDGDFCSNVQGTVWSIIPGIRKDLHPHQREGFEFLWKNIGGGIEIDKLKKKPSNSDSGSGCIISHAPGTGKTRLAIVFLQTYMKLYPTCRPVIIAPRSMLLSWEAEFRKWKVDIPFYNLNESKLSGKENTAAMNFVKSGQHSVNFIRMVKLYSWKKDTSVLGISYKLFEELAGEDYKRSKVTQKKTKVGNVQQILLELPGLLVLDEGHTPRNAQSLIWKALSRVQTRKRIILSGTPFQNNFLELFNTVCLARPQFADLFENSSSGHLNRRKTNGKKNRASGNWKSLTNPIDKEYTDDIQKAERLEEVRAKIRPFVHIHRGNILQQSLPGLRDAVIYLNPEQLQKQLLDRVLQGTKNLGLHLEHPFSLVNVHPSLCKITSYTQGLRMLDTDRLKPELGAKTKFIMELIKLSVALKEKVLVFSQYLEPLHLIGEQLVGQLDWNQGREVLHMHGAVNTVQRHAMIKCFNDEKSEAKVMLASTKACCEGINLVGASRVVLLDVVWNPSVERQAISRAYRLGQKKVVHVYHLITVGTIEEGKHNRQGEKERLSDLVFCSSERPAPNQKQSSANIPANRKDGILESMVESGKLKTILHKIRYQYKDYLFVDSFGMHSL